MKSARIQLGGTPEKLVDGAGSNLAVTGMMVFFGSRDYDVTAKSDRLISIFPENSERAAAAPRPQINIAVNWSEELNKRVAAP